jgi:Iap family predicted aminopeptidase
VLALSLDEAKNLALVAATVFAIGAIAAIWVMKTIVQKVLVAVLLIMLAFAAWSQRESLQDCADKVEANIRIPTSATTTSTTAPTAPAATGGESTGSATCTFFGVDVTIP